MLTPLARQGGAAVLVLLIVLGMVPEVHAQDAVLEALRQQRLRARVAEALYEVAPRAVVYGPTEIAYDGQPLRRLTPTMPTLKMPEVSLAPLAVRPQPTPAPVAETAEVPLLTEIRWQRVNPGDEGDFLARFGESLWTSASRYARTPIDTMATPEVRARLNNVFGPPTRSPVGRGRPEAQSGSTTVQFEYWFVANDSIPLVLMDRDGPFGRGLVAVVDEVHVPLAPQLLDSIAERLMGPSVLMPYVDYYHSRERGKWYRTGFDGNRYYVIETERPRWARRGQNRGGWYDFR